MDYDLANPLGREFTLIVKGVERTDLANFELIKKAISEAATSESMSVLKFGINENKNNGTTIIGILNRSHIIVHTFPEFRTMYVSIYTSKGPREGQSMVRIFTKYIPHTDVIVTDRRIDLLTSSGMLGKIV
jgi:S-adenosylmethionine/arginine decarboxylase-like enzyme